MELVTLAQATLHRAGSASAHGMVRQNEVSGTHEVADATVDTLRELVLSIAEKHGDPREGPQAMIQVPAYQYTSERDMVVFNIQPRNVQYGLPYATCRAFPALKIDGRYFKLDEVLPG